MGRRYRHNVFTGVYSHSSRMPAHGGNGTSITRFAQLATTYFWTAFYSINVHYMAVATVFLVVLLSFILPDISQKIHRTTELKAMKKVIDTMSKEVSRAEVACLTVAKQLGCLQCSMKDDSTETTKDNKDLAVSTSRSICTTQSEPVQAEKKIGFLRRIFFPNKNTSIKEITIMSYLYTDSFDAVDKNKEAPEANTKA